MDKQKDRQFVAYWFFVSWSAISFGVHVDFMCPNLEIHLPFGFFRIGWQGVYTQTKSAKLKSFGITRK